MTNNVAKISWCDGHKRYELHILNKLKAYSTADEPDQENNQETHAQGKKDLIKLAQDKGYTVIEA